MSSLPPLQDSVSESSNGKPVPVHNSPMSGSVTHDDAEKQPHWPKIRTIWQDAFSEFFGTMVLILFGDGVVAQVVLSGGTKGEYQSISWGWG